MGRPQFTVGTTPVHDSHDKLDSDGLPVDRDVSILPAFARAILRQQSLEDLMWSLAERIGTLLCFDDCVIYLIEDGVLVQKAAFGVKNPVGREIFEPITIPIGEGIVGRVAKLGVAEMIRDVRNDPTYIPDQFPGMSELAVPIIFEDRVIGVLDSEADEVAAYSEDDREALQWLANISAPRIVSAQREERLKLAEQELRQANEHLEQRVSERTRDLSNAIVRLEDEIEERERMERALEVEKQRAQATLQSMSEGVIAVDPYGRILLFNKAAEEITGWVATEALGQFVDELIRTAPVDVLIPVGQEDSTTDASTWSDTFLHVDDREDRRLRRRDGTELRVHQTRAPVLNVSGEKLGDVLVLRDETARRELMEEVERSQRLESLGILAGGIAHDFNNLLAVVRGSIDLLADARGAHDTERALRRAVLACEEAATLPKQLISLAKGGEPVLGAPSSITPIVQRAVDVMVDSDRFVVASQIEPNPLTARFDETQISSLLQNLLKNAQQAMGDRGRLGVRIWNSVFAEDNRPCIRVSIEDSGPGIPQGQLDQIFNPFYSTKGSGSGIGLTTAHSIARRHGGTLTVRSEVGTGTVFELALPASDSPAQMTPARRETTVETQGPGGHIFVLEDEPSILEVVELFLTSMGHTTQLFTRGELLLDALREQPEGSTTCDLILTDLVIRDGWGGVEVMRALRDEGMDVPVVVMSGYASDPVFASRIEYGYAGTLAKPFTKADLERVVLEALQTRPQADPSLQPPDSTEEL